MCCGFRNQFDTFARIQSWLGQTRTAVQSSAERPLRRLAPAANPEQQTVVSIQFQTLQNTRAARARVRLIGKHTHTPRRHSSSCSRAIQTNVGGGGDGGDGSDGDGDRTHQQRQFACLLACDYKCIGIIYRYNLSVYVLALAVLVCQCACLGVCTFSHTHTHS